MKAFVPFLVLFPVSSTVLATEITDKDAGTYVFVGKNSNQTGMFYRLSKNGDKWVMEGKTPGGNWESIDCDPGCEYRRTTDPEIQTHFPADWRAEADIACIQNVAQVFCRYNLKKDMSKTGYMVIALANGKPTPIFMWRVSSAAPVSPSK